MVRSVSRVHLSKLHKSVFDWRGSDRATEALQVVGTALHGEIRQRDLPIISVDNRRHAEIACGRCGLIDVELEVSVDVSSGSLHIEVAAYPL